MRLSFYDHHRQSYGALPIDEAAEFMVGDYGEPGETNRGVDKGGEFKIELVRLRASQRGRWTELTPRMAVFGDAMGSLAEALRLGIADVMEDTYASADDFSAALVEIGIYDRSEFPVGSPEPKCSCCGRPVERELVAPREEER